MKISSNYFPHLYSIMLNLSIDSINSDNPYLLSYPQDLKLSYLHHLWSFPHKPRKFSKIYILYAKETFVIQWAWSKFVPASKSENNVRTKVNFYFFFTLIKFSYVFIASHLSIAIVFCLFSFVGIFSKLSTYWLHVRISILFCDNFYSLSIF